MRRQNLALLVAAASLVASSAWAQPANFSDVPDRFRLELGGFRIGADSELTFNSSGGARPPVNFESLNLPDNATRVYVEGFWRPWRRHEFSLSWYRNARTGEGTTVQRDFTWGDRVINAGASINARVKASYLSGVYRFAAYKNDRFEIGPSVGIGYLSIDAGIEGSVTGAGGTDSRSFDLSPSLGQPTGDLGTCLFTGQPAVEQVLVARSY